MPHKPAPRERDRWGGEVAVFGPFVVQVQVEERVS